MASVASQFVVEVTAHAQSDGLEDAREICADGTYCPNNLRSIALPPFKPRVSLLKLTRKSSCGSNFYRTFKGFN